jgi:hypothetical protein
MAEFPGACRARALEGAANGVGASRKTTGHRAAEQAIFEPGGALLFSILNLVKRFGRHWSSAMATAG